MPKRRPKAVALPPGLEAAWGLRREPTRGPRPELSLPRIVDAGVVTKGKTGRTTSLRLVPGSLEELGAWAMSTRLMWSHALDRLEQHLSDDPREG